MEQFFAKPRDREPRPGIPVVNICKINGVESGLPRGEQEIILLDETDVTQVYDGALLRKSALPIVVGISHAGELIPEGIVSRVRDTNEFLHGLDRGTAWVFPPLMTKQIM